ncbi:hypothetical protein [Streptomyces sp. NPDC096339]|uniref:hypothetical protein n=1 Tax=Streptomyces sp. NPDC096339 TaxID=3366086 RepID=UPI003816A524
MVAAYPIGGGAKCVRLRDDRRWVRRSGSGDIDQQKSYEEKEHPLSVRSVLAVPAAAHASVQPIAADAYELTSGRLVGTTAALVALTGVVIGAVAVVLGLIAAALGRLALVRSRRR